MPTHTPGPWIMERVTVKDSLGIWVNDVRTTQGLLVARCVSAPERSRNSAEANARLIAAAPALLEALEDMLFAHAARGLLQECAHNKARAAIAQAKGETNGS